MTVPLRTPDELQAAPALATLPALSACIEAFLAVLDVAHPSLVMSSGGPATDREAAALLLHMHLDTCQQLLHDYDRLTFDVTSWCCDEPEGPDHDHEEQDSEGEDIPF
jgi:hypothetical protein